MSKQTEKEIYFRKDGGLEGCYPKEQGNERIEYGHVFGRTYEEAKYKLDQAVDVSDKIETATMKKFADLSEEWLQIQKPELKASSIAKYSNILHSYLIPKFGERDIRTISRNDAVLFSRELLAHGGVRANGLTPKTVNGTLSVLKSVFEYMRQEKGIPVADISNISVRQPQKTMQILGRSEQQCLSRFLCSNPTPRNLGILLCLYTGMRIGEICALKWEDIYITEQCIRVHRTMQRIQISEKEGDKTKVVIQAPKSDCSNRKIPIPSGILPILISAQKNGKTFLLTGLEERYVEPRNMENYFKSVVKTCQITNVNFHALRHTFATRCVELGFDVKSLSEILGHANVNITLNRYVHPSMDLKQKNMDMLSGLLNTK